MTSIFPRKMSDKGSNCLVPSQNFVKMMGLVEYSSSDDDSADDKEANVTQKTEETNVQTKGKESANKLPVPDDIQNLFSKGNTRSVDNPSEHGGRIRSFPHEEGNWATSIYIPTEYADDENFDKLRDQLFDCLRPLEFQRMKEYHISLSRTVAIRHHWIEEIKKSLSKEFARSRTCACEISYVQVYVNDEKTRSFLGLQVNAVDDGLIDYVQIVDQCFDGYKLPKYYKPPSFHISIGWCLGDVSDRVTKKMEDSMKQVLQTCILELDEGGYFRVDHIAMKTGNKEFIFPLSKSS